MVDLFLQPKVLDYTGDKYELIRLTMRWARTLKARGTAEPMQSLIEKALSDIIDGKITSEEIMATPAPVIEKPKEPADLIATIEDIPGSRTLAPDDEEDTDKKKAKKKKKDE